jgi:hypothetical protein
MVPPHLDVYCRSASRRSVQQVRDARRAGRYRLQMQIGPALNSAVSGLTRADRSFDGAAAGVAADPTSVDDIVTATMTAPAAFTANAGVWRTADEMRGTLIDMLG